jgi:peptidase C25-like protein
MKASAGISTRPVLFTICALLGGVLCGSSAFMQQSGGPYTVNPSVISGGGGISSSGNTSITGTIGQGVLGASTGGTFSVSGGFWSADGPCSAPGIGLQPASQTGCAGSPVTFSVTASGSGLSYQWRKNTANLINGGNISGAQSATLSINPTAPGDAGSYDVVITGGCGNATSDAASLLISDYSLSSPSASFPGTGGTGSVSVITAATCPWTAVSNDGWISITSGASGTGNGAVNYSVGSNTGGGRTGAITVAGLTYTVNQAAPTAIDLISFNATAYDDGVFFQWQTGLEIDNLGFNIYRDEGGKLSSINPQLVAGSALLIGQGVTLGSGYSYSWWDASPAGKVASYWLEDRDTNGQSVWHGPFIPVQSHDKHQGAVQQARTLSELSGNYFPSSPIQTRSTFPPSADSASSPESQVQRVIAGLSNSVKLQVNHEAWYRIAGSELLAAGLDPSVDPRKLQLFVDGKQQAIRIAGEKDGHLDGDDSVEFYGVGIDSPFTDARTYYLIAGPQDGLRIATIQSSAHPSPLGDFAITVERRERTIYFAALRNGDKENFFGAIVASQPVNQSLTLNHLASSTEPASLRVALQGLTNVPHSVSVQLNGTDLGRLAFEGQAAGQTTISVPPSTLREGSNQVTLTSRGSPSDVSLVDFIQLTYQHSFTADDDALKFTASAREPVTIDGFTTESIQVLDVTDPFAVQEVSGFIDKQSRPDGQSQFSISLRTPGKGQRSLLAITREKASSDARVTRDSPSNLRDPAQSADLVIVTRREMFAATQGLKDLRQKQGMSVAVVDIEDVYDEFGFGQKSPQAIKDFLRVAMTTWKRPMKYVLFFGDASMDPRNYLGFGDSDLVPTRLIDTQFMEAPSDEWFADSNNDGIAEVAIGRLPARNSTEAALMISKILAYEQSAAEREALLVSDRNDGADFEASSDHLIPLLPEKTAVTQVKRGQLGDQAARASLIDGINRGQRMVNYVGHGSVNLWRGGLLTSSDALQLQNREHLSVFVIMNCLNGYFVDPAIDSLGEALLTSSAGAVAVWASSSMTFAETQTPMNQEFYRQVFGARARLGDASMKARQATSDSDARRTWVLLGDPTMKVK